MYGFSSHENASRPPNDGSATLHRDPGALRSDCLTDMGYPGPMVALTDEEEAASDVPRPISFGVLVCVFGAVAVVLCMAAFWLIA